MACTAEQVAEEGLEAYRRGDAVCIPGRLNQLGAVFAQVSSTDDCLASISA